MQPNNVKDSNLTGKRDLIQFRNTGSTKLKLKDDQEQMFNEYEVEEEMTSIKKMERFHGILAQSSKKSLKQALENIDIMDETMNFEI